MRIARYFAIAFVLALPLSSCELFDCGCAYEMKEIRHRYGHPDQQSTFKSSRGYRAENWRYEPTGGKWRSYTFEWQEYEACECEVIGGDLLRARSCGQAGGAALARPGGRRPLRDVPLRQWGAGDRLR